MRSRSDLYPYQEKMIRHMLNHPNCAVWAEMGLGKTVACLTAIQILRDQFFANRVLVIAPLRVANLVWKQEVEAWDHLSLKVVRVTGPWPERQRALNQKAHIHVINRENVLWLISHIEKNGELDDWPWDMIVIDESASFKSPSSKRFRALLRAMPYKVRMVQLTGTPAPNGVADLWSQIHLLDGGERLGRNVTAFRKRWFNYIHNAYKHAPKQGAVDEIHRRVADIALSMKAEDYLDLPDVLENDIRVELEPHELAKYRELRRKFVIEIDGEQVTAISAASLWNKLLQLSSGAVYTTHPAYQVLHWHKIGALRELHQSHEGQLLVVYHYVSDLERIEGMFKKEKANWRKLGSDKDVEDWNKGKFDRLVIHPASAGHGLQFHLGGCRAIVWFGPTPSLELWQQTNARIAGGHRAAHSNKPIVIHRITAAGTQDEDVYELLAAKGSHQTALMNATKKLIKETT